MFCSFCQMYSKAGRGLNGWAESSFPWLTAAVTVGKSHLTCKGLD